MNDKASRAGVARDRTHVVSPVKGGWVKRDSSSGRFVAVQGESGVTKATSRTEIVVGEASAKRREALKRLADR